MFLAIFHALIFATIVTVIGAGIWLVANKNPLPELVWFAVACIIAAGLTGIL